mgnify:FL=1|tara:strand:+ start:103 stop:1410 length:1308 start_codon:yes stop_codon:yes gene_type:complete
MAASVDELATKLNDASVKPDSPAKPDSSAKPRGSRAGVRNPDTYNIFQWNQKQLTLAAPTSSEYKLSMKRIDNIVQTIHGETPSTGLGICVMQEVNAGGGGEAALNLVVTKLNEKKFHTDRGNVFDAQCSGVVNPMVVRNQEKFGIIWNKRLFGELHATEEFAGFRLLTEGLDPVDGKRVSIEEKDYIVQLGKASINLNRARDTWKQIRIDGKINEMVPQFDRMPVLFSFTPPGFGKDLHLLVSHSSIKEHQNIVETVFLQEICAQAAAQGEYVILLGDFNVDEADVNRLWDTQEDLNEANEELDHGLDETALLSDTKTSFLQHYYRAVNKAHPTNTYPFMSGLTAEPAHNDDIWLPKMTDPFHMDAPSGNRQPGKVVRIPKEILEQWDKTTQTYFDAIGGLHAEKKKVSRNKLNGLLARSWSDHRPLIVSLKKT